MVLSNERTESRHHQQYPVITCAPLSQGHNWQGRVNFVYMNCLKQGPPFSVGEKLSGAESMLRAGALAPARRPHAYEGCVKRTPCILAALENTSCFKGQEGSLDSPLWRKEFSLTDQAVPKLLLSGKKVHEQPQPQPEFLSEQQSVHLSLGHLFVYLKEGWCQGTGKEVTGQLARVSPLLPPCGF